MQSSTHSARFLAAAILLVATLLEGCSPLSIAQPPLASPARSEQSVEVPILPEAPQPLQFPVGRFKAMSYPSLLVIAIENDYQYRVFVDHALIDSGTFIPANDQIKVDSLKCSEQGYKPVPYGWVYSEDGLAFQVIGSDPCSERRQYMSEDFEPQYLFIDVISAPHRIGS